MRQFKKDMKFQNKAAKLISLLFVASGAALIWMFGGYTYAIIPQTVGFSLLAVAIYIASAYLLRQLTFSLEIRNSEADNIRDKYDFLIKEIRSGREIKHCHISLSDITLVRKVTKENKKQVNKERKEMRRYTFDTCFAPKCRIEIVAKDGDDTVSMLISYDEELFALLSEAIK